MTSQWLYRVRYKTYRAMFAPFTASCNRHVWPPQVAPPHSSHLFGNPTCQPIPATPVQHLDLVSSAAILHIQYLAAAQSSEYLYSCLWYAVVQWYSILVVRSTHSKSMSNSPQPCSTYGRGAGCHPRNVECCCEQYKYS